MNKSKQNHIPVISTEKTRRSHHQQETKSKSVTLNSRDSSPVDKSKQLQDEIERYEEARKELLIDINKLTLWLAEIKEFNAYDSAWIDETINILKKLGEEK